MAGVIGMVLNCRERSSSHDRRGRRIEIRSLRTSQASSHHVIDATAKLSARSIVRAAALLNRCDSWDVHQ
jgi:hypothetical protein